MSKNRYLLSHAGSKCTCLDVHRKQHLIVIKDSNKQLRASVLQLSELVAGALCQVPIGLQEVVVHLVNQDTRHRPSARTLVQISYFGSV